MNIYLIVTFTIVICMLVAIGWFRKLRHEQVNAIASIVTIIGVLGTFLGIAIGLYQFDTENIEASVPQLLEGLKIAFLTSIVGIGLSILLKAEALQRKQRETYTGATVDDLAGLLRNISAVEQEEGQETREILRSTASKSEMRSRSQGQETREILRSIERSLTGEGDSTVLTQLQKLETIFSNKQDDLIRAFNEFAAQMAENNTKALIEALKEVIEDFNAKINEQFGDNFKQLNEAVGRINEWQEQYRQQMDELAVEFRIAAESIEKSRQSLEIIAERSDAIVSSAERLSPILEAIQHQIDQLEANLEAFHALADNARNAFPIIEDRLNKLTNDFSNVVRETIDDSDKAMKNQREALVNQSKQLEKTVKENTHLMAQQITVLDTALQNELTRALESLGSQLTSLSRRFVDDYSPLTAQLREVVQMASNLPQPSGDQRPK